MYLLVTNNRLCFDKYRDRVKVDFLEDGSYLDVLVKTRDYAQEGKRIETHPMAGSIKPNQTPFRSVLLSDGKMDTDEFIENELMIEDAVLMTRKFLSDRPVRKWDESIVNDFRQVDLELISGAIDRVV
ncbi:MAG: GrdX family protein [Lacrimispora saccharolytica]